MIIRKIKPEELKRTEEIFSAAFNFPYEKEMSEMELYQTYTENPKNREQEFCLERFAAFEDDDKTMMSYFILNPFQVQFDGHQESMYGIGGVATLPQYRKSGGIRACFTEALPYMYKKDVVFSYLYPFSTAFYRKFGYEMCGRRQIYSVSLQHIPACKVNGKSYLLDRFTAERAMEDIPKVYSGFQKKYNIMTLGIPYDFTFIQSAEPYKDQTFTYVYCSEVKEPLAYMTFRCVLTPGDRHLECSQLCYLNREGLEGMLALVKTFASDFGYIRFPFPESSDLELILPEWSMNAVKRESGSNGMVRVINAKKALQDAAYRGSGSISIRIEDSYIEENNRTFHVTFKEGVCEKIVCSDEEADITMPIGAFSALLTGGHDTSAVEMFDGVHIHKKCEALAGIFYKKPVYIMTGF